MSPEDARALLGDVVNLEARLTAAKDAIGQAEAKVVKANAAQSAAAEAVAAAEAGVVAAQARLDGARALLVDVPTELLNAAAVEIGGQLTQKARYLEALAAGPDAAELDRVTAAARAAGMDVTFAQSEAAESAGAGNDAGSN